MTPWGQKYWDWLRQLALPIWSTLGIDPEGGFEELIGLNGVRVPAPRRARVQGRQSFAFAIAGKMGWQGPWKQVAPIGLDWMERYYRRKDGLYCTAVNPDGSVLEETAMTYDQAFALLASAAMKQQGLGPGEDYALELMERVVALRGLPQGGFGEADGRFLSNPHMHLFEAALAWMETGKEGLWEQVGREIVTLALTRFIDTDRRVLREVFDSDWRSGDVVEPGHQFEWAWLLERWARAVGDAPAHTAALDLFIAGKRGVDAQRLAAIDEMEVGLGPKRGTARLWPQTEWLKAACLLGDETDIDAAAASLWRYLETPVHGLWRDKMREDGSFVDEPAPASSLYHIICAVASLKDLI